MYEPTGRATGQPPATAGITEIWVPSGVAVVEVVEEADVVVADVDVDEAAQLAGLVEDPAPDAGVVRVEVVEHLGEGAALGAHLGLTAGVGAQDGRDPDADAHGAPRSGSGLAHAVRRCRWRRRRRTTGRWSPPDRPGRTTASRVFRPSPVLITTVSRVGVELAGLDELLQHADRGAAGGLGEDALGAGQQQDAVADLVVGDVLDRAAGAAADVEHVEAVGGVADGQATWRWCPA